jgi:uncharacterized protein with FMN-binding domain
MRRVLVALLGATFGTALLIGAKAYTSPPADSPVIAEGTFDPLSNAANNPQDPTGSAGPSSAPTSASPHPTATSTPSGTSPTSAPPNPAKRTIVGTAFAAKGYGSVQVQVVMTGTHIDDVQVLKMSNRPLNAPAKLRQEALTKQSAQLTNVSGATYTSQAYMQSLQSALNKA